MAKHGRLVNIPKWSKGAQKGPKWSTWKFLTIWDPCGPGWTISNDSNDFLLKSTSAKPYFVLMGQQIDFCLKWSKSVQMGSKGSNLSKTTRFTILDPFGFQGNLLPIRRDNRQ